MARERNNTYRWPSADKVVEQHTLFKFAIELNEKAGENRDVNLNIAGFKKGTG